MSEALDPDRLYSVHTAHDTVLGCDPDSASLRHGPPAGERPALLFCPARPGAGVLARADGEPVAYEGHGSIGGSRRWVPCLLTPAQTEGAVGLALPGHDVLTALPGGEVAGDRQSVGGWEGFRLRPAPTPPGLVTRPGPSAAEFPAACADPATPTEHLLAGLTRLDRAALAAHQPSLSARRDYRDLFATVRMFATGGRTRTPYGLRSHLEPFIRAYGWPIGDFSYGTPTIVDGDYGSLEIGRYCSIAGNVNIIVANHAVRTATTYPFAALRDLWPSTPPGIADHGGDGVVIGNNVWIGMGVTILPGARIGDGAIVGAGAVVARHVPPFSVAVGNPAKVVRLRFAEHVVARLVRLRWWDWPAHEVDRLVPHLLDEDVDGFLRRAELTRRELDAADISPAAARSH